MMGKSDPDPGQLVPGMHNTGFYIAHIAASIKTGFIIFNIV
jgi:hypothetical protein